MYSNSKDQLSLEESYRRVHVVEEHWMDVASLLATTATLGLTGLYYYLKNMSQEQLQKLISDPEFVKNIEEAKTIKKKYDIAVNMEDSDEQAKWSTEHSKIAQKIQNDLHEHGYNLKLAEIENKVKNLGI